MRSREDKPNESTSRAAILFKLKNYADRFKNIQNEVSSWAVERQEMKQKIQDYENLMNSLKTIVKKTLSESQHRIKQHKKSEELAQNALLTCQKSYQTSHQKTIALEHQNHFYRECFLKFLFRGSIPVGYGGKRKSDGEIFIRAEKFFDNVEQFLLKWSVSQLPLKEDKSLTLNEQSVNGKKREALSEEKSCKILQRHIAVLQHREHCERQQCQKKDLYIKKLETRLLQIQRKSVLRPITSNVSVSQPPSPSVVSRKVDFSPVKVSSIHRSRIKNFIRREKMKLIKEKKKLGNLVAKDPSIEEPDTLLDSNTGQEEFMPSLEVRGVMEKRSKQTALPAKNLTEEVAKKDEGYIGKERKQPTLNEEGNQWIFERSEDFFKRLHEKINKCLNRTSASRSLSPLSILSSEPGSVIGLRSQGIFGKEIVLSPPSSTPDSSPLTSKIHECASPSFTPSLLSLQSGVLSKSLLDIRTNNQSIPSPPCPSESQHHSLVQHQTPNGGNSVESLSPSSVQEGRSFIEFDPSFSHFNSKMLVPVVPALSLSESFSETDNNSYLPLVGHAFSSVTEDYCNRIKS